MATREKQREHNAKQTVRKRQPRFDIPESANRSRDRIQKDKKLSESVFSAPVRDAEWAKVPFGDATVPEKELEAAKSRAVEAMTEWGVLVESSRASGLGRDVLYRMMRADEVFRLRMRVAKRNCMERIEREMIRRGQLKGGDLAGIFVTKHNIPKYREIQRVELTGKGGGPVGYVDVKGELLKRLESLATKRQASDTPIAVGEKPRIGLLKGGSDNAERKIRKAESGGYEVKSRK